MPGGHRAVIFDRLNGVRDKVSLHRRWWAASWAGGERGRSIGPGPRHAQSTELTRTALGQASEEGTHLLVPWLQRAILYDVRSS